MNTFEIFKADIQESVIRTNAKFDFNVLDYRESVLAYRAYETNGKGGYDSRKDSLNRMFSAAGGRAYSIHYMMQGLTLTEVSRLQSMRFIVDGITIVGRDIMRVTSIRPNEVKRMVANVLKADSLKTQKDGKKYARRTMTVENGEVKYFTTGNGKRTYHGKPDDGMGHYKDFSREPKQYKRNRKVR